MDSAYQTVVRHLTQQLGVDPARVTPETTLGQLERDSLSILEFGLLLQEATGLGRLDDRMLTFRTTVGDLAEALHRHQTGPVAGAVLAGDR